MAKLFIQQCMYETAVWCHGMALIHSCPMLLCVCQQIDGEAFLLLTQTDIVRVLKIKLGPAIKIYNSILMIRNNAGVQLVHLLTVYCKSLLVAVDILFIRSVVLSFLAAVSCTRGRSRNQVQGLQALSLTLFTRSLSFHSPDLPFPSLPSCSLPSFFLFLFSSPFSWLRGLIEHLSFPGRSKCFPVPFKLKMMHLVSVYTMALCLIHAKTVRVNSLGAHSQ